MAEPHASHAAHDPAHAKPEPAPSRSVVYAGFALLAILLIAALAYTYTQVAAVQVQLNRVAPAADRLAGLDARVQQLEAVVPRAAQFQLLYDGSCEFCDNELLLQDAAEYNFENEPRGLRLVPTDVRDRLDLVRNASIPFLPAVLALEPEARRNGYSWDLVRSEGARGPVFVRIPGGWYGGLSTEGHPRPSVILGPSCRQGDRLTVDFFYGLRCPLCATVNETLQRWKAALGDRLVVREHCLPLDGDEVQACAQRASEDEFNQTMRILPLWGVGYAPTTVFDCQYAQSSASLKSATDRACLVRPDLCDALRAAGSPPAATGNATNSSA
jgi:hypothetical protein